MNPLVALMLLKAGAGGIQGGMQRGQMNDIGSGYQMYTEYSPQQRLGNALTGALGGGMSGAEQALPALWEQSNREADITRQEQSEIDRLYSQQQDRYAGMGASTREEYRRANQDALASERADREAARKAKLNEQLLQQSNIEAKRRASGETNSGETTDWGWLGAGLPSLKSAGLGGSMAAVSGDIADKQRMSLAKDQFAAAGKAETPDVSATDKGISGGEEAYFKSLTAWARSQNPPLDPRDPKTQQKYAQYAQKVRDEESGTSTSLADDINAALGR